MALSLPRFVVLESNVIFQYLRHEPENKQVQGCLKLSGESIVDPCAKFEFEMATCNSAYVHIRSCYNNKYLVSDSEHDNWIVAKADLPEEEQRKESCSLFEPIQVGGDAKTIKLKHVKSGHYVSSKYEEREEYDFDDEREGETKGSKYYTVATTTVILSSYQDSYTITDWETLVMLPKHVAFKGYNGKYLQLREHGSRFMTFAATDIGDPMVGFEIITNKDGSIRIKNDYNGNYWWRDAGWIWPVSDGKPNDVADRWFWPVKVDDNVIALRSLGNNYYCSSRDDDDNKNCLSAAVTTTITAEARLVVKELILSRKIYNVKFQLDHAKIYGQTVLTMAHGEVINMTNRSIEKEVRLSYKEYKCSKWDANLSLKLGFKSEVQFGVPFVSKYIDLKAQINFSAEFEGQYSWGEVIEKTEAFETNYKVTVNPMTRVTIYMLATKATCDIPFSYTQRDILTNGKHVVYNNMPGSYTGVNCFDFHFKADEKKATQATHHDASYSTPLLMTTI